MANDLQHQSLGQNTEGSSQETSNQGSSISFDFEGNVPAIAQSTSMASKYEAMADLTGWKLQMKCC